ncbi:hypothetical protein [Mesorhizobium amorphae]|uniref:hypothetical protein n=1 Tax=Mesorhizobium amorphae TaxID=71433 RepID=UPI001AED3F0E
MTDLKERMRKAAITDDEMTTFQRVAALISDGQGRIGVLTTLSPFLLLPIRTATRRPRKAAAVFSPAWNLYRHQISNANFSCRHAGDFGRARL